MAVEVRGGPGGGARQLREPRQHRRVLAQQREVRAATGDGIEQREEAQEDRLCLRCRGGVAGDDGPAVGRGRHGEELRHQRVEALLRQRRQSEVAAAALDPLEAVGELGRIVESGGGERGQRRVPGDVPPPDGGERFCARPLEGRVAPILLSARWRRRRCGIRVLRRRIGAEDGGKVRCDGAAMAPSIASNAVVSAHSGRLRQRRALVVGGGQHLRLRVVAVLQSVLDIAQEDVRGAQFVRGARRHHSALGDRSERRQGAASAQRRLPAAADDLQRLHDELDLADAAGAELDVGGVVAALALFADLAMDVAQTLRTRRNRGTCGTRTA